MSAKNAKAARQAVQSARQAGMSTNLKVTLGVVAAAVAVLVAVVAVNLGGSARPAGADALVRADSHRLNSASDGKVTVVEFLDFECESCLAAYPGVEQLRAEYADRITYVVRYFPIASHPNARTAAHAAEAAARQGKFELMYKKLFDSSQAWTHKQEPQTALFEQYAQQLGLDLTKFRADAAGAEVAARVEADSRDGANLGVQGTPTFFVNGTRFEGQPSYAGLKSAVDEALAA